jgi:hypothetical protein
MNGLTSRTLPSPSRCRISVPSISWSPMRALHATTRRSPAPNSSNTWMPSNVSRTTDISSVTSARPSKRNREVIGEINTTSSLSAAVIAEISPALTLRLGFAFHEAMGAACTEFERELAEPGRAFASR